MNSVLDGRLRPGEARCCYSTPSWVRLASQPRCSPPAGLPFSLSGTVPGAGPATAQPPLHLAACSCPHLSWPWGTVSAPGAKGHLGLPAGTDRTPHPSAGAQHLPWPSTGLWFWQTQKAVNMNSGAWIVRSAPRSGAGACSATES